MLDDMQEVSRGARALVLAVLVSACGDDVTPADESTGSTATGSTDGPETLSSSSPSTSGTASTSTTSDDTTGESSTTNDDTTDDSSTTSDDTTTTSDDTTTTSDDTTTTSDDTTTTSDDTTTTGPELCGNGVIDDDELCDGAELDGEDCISQGADAGELACADDCTFDLSDCVMFSCGDDVITAPEVCDNDDLAGEDCVSLGFPAGGALACSDLCSYDTSGCLGPQCGDGIAEAPEDCDGDDLAGGDCTTVGSDGGTLACALDCTFDDAACFLTEALQNDNGNCGFTEVGCDLGMGGNPQDILECYVSNLVPPLDVAEVEYFLGDSVPLPDALDLVVVAWDGPGSTPGALLGSFALDPMLDIVTGGHVFVLPMPIASSAASFCIGFHGEDPLDGFRVDFTDDDATGESWFTAEACGIAMPTELTGLFTPGNFCIRPTVHGQ